MYSALFKDKPPKTAFKKSFETRQVVKITVMYLDKQKYFVARALNFLDCEPNVVMAPNLLVYLKMMDLSNDNSA